MGELRKCMAINIFKAMKLYLASFHNNTDIGSVYRTINKISHSLSVCQKKSICHTKKHEAMWVFSFYHLIKVITFDARNNQDLSVLEEKKWQFTIFIFVIFGPWLQVSLWLSVGHYLGGFQNRVIVIKCTQYKCCFYLQGNSYYY